MSAPTPDLSQPLSVLLAQATKQVHDQVASSAGAAALGSGNLSREEYVKYLIYLWHIYTTLETALDKHASHPSIASTYNPTILGRAQTLSSDISAFLQTPNWQAHPINLSLSPPPPPLLEYVERLRAISATSEPTPLLAHAYVRYLGDLSGGQYIKRVVVKTYQVDNDAASFYDFAKPGGRAGEMANQGDIIKMKASFKEGMNESIVTDEHKQMLLDETRLAFRYNDQLLRLLSVSAPLAATEDSKKPIKVDSANTLKTLLNRPSTPYYAFGLSLVVAHTVLLLVTSPDARSNSHTMGCAFLNGLGSLFRGPTHVMA